MDNERLEKILNMTLEEVTERLAALEIEVRDATAIEAVNEAIEEKKLLLERKSELESLQERKNEALRITESFKGKGELRAFGAIAGKEGENMFEGMSPVEVRGTEVYRSAFIKGLQGKALTDLEKRANEMASTDVAGVIPTMTQDKIFEKAVQLAPILQEIQLLHVPGNITFAVEGTNTAAALHAENTLAAPAGDSMLTVNLAGYEIIKILRISATVKAMAINAFENWLVQYLAKGIARKVGEFVFYGTGVNQPKGVDYAATWVAGTNGVAWNGTSPTQKELVTLVGLLPGGYHQNAKFAMNSQTFWAEIVAAQSNDKFKILTDDYKRLLGYEVLLDDNIAYKDIFFGDFSYMVGNFAQGIKVDRSAESGFLYNAVDFRGTAIFDCDVAIAEAFVKSAKDLTAGK